MAAKHAAALRAVPETTAPAPRPTHAIRAPCVVNSPTPPRHLARGKRCLCQSPAPWQCAPPACHRDRAAQHPPPSGVRSASGLCTRPQPSPSRWDDRRNALGRTIAPAQFLSIEAIEYLTLAGSDKFESNCPSASYFIFPGTVLCFYAGDGGASAKIFFSSTIRIHSGTGYKRERIPMRAGGPFSRAGDRSQGRALPCRR